jgi:hypothetical protein
LTELARHFVDRAVAAERLDQPLPEMAQWAASALVAGYCLRRVEESAADGSSARSRAATDSTSGRAPGRRQPEGPCGADVSTHCDAPDAAEATSGHLEPDELRRLDAQAGRLGALVRLGRTGDFAIADPRTVESALDRLVHSAVSNRLQPWADDVDDAAWDELGEYLTWWTVKGYALRVAETQMASASTASPEHHAGP